jgi:large subunit ribosomal protein L5
MNRLYLWYEHILRKDLIYKSHSNCFLENPFLDKIIVSSSLNAAIQDSTKIIPVIVGLELITNQKPVVYYSKKSIARFKVQKNMPIGCKVILRKQIMYDFFDLFLLIVLPKINNFKGFKVIKQKKGNISIGISDLSVIFQFNNNYFPKDFGLTITFNLKSNTHYPKELILNNFQIPINKNK